MALAATVGFAVLMMVILGSDAYLWIKAIHVIAIIAWMAGMLYLPRLFVYHADAPVGSAQSELFKLMEYRLLTIIMHPAMVVSWVLGLWLVWQAGHYTQGWMLAKFVLALGMSGVHGFLSASVRRFAADANEKPARYWRMMNEVPTVLMFAIVLLVIVKPF